ncbi:S-layer homology domain-containing protein [Marinitoga sp. 38H-ov]|uniref:S-layer homology domain-containing protein n=1 Tax=Marinitoga sp. 38H-ov TaxID=1755814 RepID=UPI0013EBDC8E|nr:S-layer homology domain-containing protein [Marinitoga sp. 38H-ov]KAF2955630.1 hypothetical protein AS160_00510 [Marinitoga sp. 38H-ov]
MKKTLLVLVLVLFGAFTFAFKDVPADHWAYDYVMDLANRGIIPMEDNFNPDVVLTKAEIAVLLSDTLTFVENDPVLAKSEDIMRVEEVMKMLNTKLGNLENDLMMLKDDVAVNVENIDGLWEELDTVKADLDYVSGKNVEEHAMLKDMLSKKADMETVDMLSKDLSKTMNELETITKVAYRAFNNADMILEDTLAMQDDIYALQEDYSTFKTSISKNFLELKYNVLDLTDKFEKLSTLSDSIENSEMKLGAIESAVTANQNVLITLTKSNEELKGKVMANEEKINRANILSLVGIVLAGVALVVPFVVK